jgi:hypothetical protein
MFTGLDEIGRSINLIASTVQVDEVFNVFFGFVLVKCCPDSLTRLKGEKNQNKLNSKRKHLRAPDHHEHI